ncbi:MAG: V-type ATP synthase subunit K [Candidatus Baldrarchaeia archaeon]
MDARKKFILTQMFFVASVVLIILFMVLVPVATANSGSTQAVKTAEEQTTTVEMKIDVGLLALGAGIAVGLAGLGAGLGMGAAGSAAMGAIAERPEIFGRTMIYIVFIEAIAIYGLVIGFLLCFAITGLIP